MRRDQITATYIEWDTATLIADQKKAEGRFSEAALIYLGIHVGLRYSDLRFIKWGEVLEGNIYITERKTGKKRHVWLGEKQREWMNELYMMKASVKFTKVHHYILSRGQGEPFSRSYANKMLEQIALEYDIERLSTHSLRKTFARRIYDKNPCENTLVLLSEVLNHSNIGITKRYLGIRQEEIKTLYETL